MSSKRPPRKDETPVNPVPRKGLNAERLELHEQMERALRKVRTSLAQTEDILRLLRVVMRWIAMSAVVSVVALILSASMFVYQVTAWRSSRKVNTGKLDEILERVRAHDSIFPGTREKP